MDKAPKYRLIPEAIPAISKSTIYQKIFEEFLEGKAASVRVEMPTKKPATVHQALLKIRRTDKRFAAVSIVRRVDAIYLRK